MSAVKAMLPLPTMSGDAGSICVSVGLWRATRARRSMAGGASRAGAEPGDTTSASAQIGRSTRRRSFENTARASLEDTAARRKRFAMTTVSVACYVAVIYIADTIGTRLTPMRGPAQGLEP